MKRRHASILTWACALAWTSAALAQAPLTVGEIVHQVYESPHPYVGGAGGKEPTLVASDTVFHPGATYIALHFEQLSLADEDYLVVRSPGGKEEWTYRGTGKASLGATDGWFAAHIRGDTAVVELFSSGSHGGWGYRIDSYGRGYNQDEIDDLWAQGLGEVLSLPAPSDPSEAVCGLDDTEEAACYRTSEPAVYDRSMAVARLLMDGRVHCTGWLVGSEGHVMTNEHCVSTQSQAASIDVEFFAEGLSCATDCREPRGCPGVIEASGTVLVQADFANDFALLELPVNVTDRYGYLQMRPSGPVLDERIYIPGHPAGWGKRIAVASTHAADGGFARITSLGEPGCQGTDLETGYYADTQGGSSGSPVLSYGDHSVVALHHCRGNGPCDDEGGSRNRGVPIGAVIAALGPNLPADAVATGDSPPSACFTASCTGCTCTFDASCSSDDQGISSYSWSFGDGTGGSGVSRSHTYGAAGTYAVDLTVTDTAGQGDSDSQPVGVSACDTTPPTVAITSPEDGDWLWGPVTIEASASDASGVHRVQFRVDGDLECTDFSAPYECPIDVDDFFTGPAQLTARAFDTSQNPGDSAPVDVRFVRGPERFIGEPAHGATVSGDDVRVFGWATDPDGVASVVMMLDGQTTIPLTYGVHRPGVCAAVPVNDPNCPFVGWVGSFDSRAYANGQHSVTLTATDPQGFTTQATRTFFIDNPPPPPCTPAADTLCLRNGRFQVTATWVDQGTGVARAAPYAVGDQSGFFHFGNPQNLEIGVKVLGPSQGHWWVFHGGLTHREYTLTVTDTHTGAVRTYFKPLNDFCGDADTTAFPDGGNGLLFAPAPLEAPEGGASDRPPASTGMFRIGGPVLEEASGGSCSPGPTRLCLLDDRFQVEVLQGGEPQDAVPVSDLSGAFWFGSPSNVEVVAKVLDGTGWNGYYWFFYAGLSNQAYTVVVTDTVTGQVETWVNPQGTYCGAGATATFPQ